MSTKYHQISHSIAGSEVLTTTKKSWQALTDIKPRVNIASVLIHGIDDRICHKYVIYPAPQREAIQEQGAILPAATIFATNIASPNEMYQRVRVDMSYPQDMARLDLYN